MNNIWVESGERKDVHERMCEENLTLLTLTACQDYEKIDQYLDALSRIMMNEFWSDESPSNKEEVRQLVKDQAKQKLENVTDESRIFNEVSIAMLDAISACHKFVNGIS